MHLGTDKQVAILGDRDYRATRLDVATIGDMDTLDVAADGGTHNGALLREVAFQIVIGCFGSLVPCFGTLQFRLRNNLVVSQLLLALVFGFGNGEVGRGLLQTDAHVVVGHSVALNNEELLAGLYGCALHEIGIAEHHHTGS